MYKPGRSIAFFQEKRAAARSHCIRYGQMTTEGLVLYESVSPTAA
jgi:hypothetical protein